MKKNYILFFAIIFFSTKSFSQNCSWICNGDFENPYMVSTAGLTVTLNCWNTTASDGLMEVWGTGYNGVNSYSGIQHVELNATQAATMYQDFNVFAPGTNLTLRFAHRARANIGMTDSIEVFMGPSGGPYTSLGKYGDGPSAWGYYTTNYIVTTPGMQRLMFTPFYYSYGNIGVGNFIDAVSVCLEQATGVTEIINDGSLVRIYPNPSSTNATLKFDNENNDNFVLNVFDQQGRLVKTINEIRGNEIKLERGNLNTGFYFFTLTSSQKNISGKLNFVD